MMRLSDYIPTIAVFLATASAQVYAADPAAAAASNHCCVALSKTTLPTGKVFFPQDVAYTQSLASYFSQQESSLKPRCIVQPHSAKDVSAAVKTLTRLGDKACPFAVRAGGHTPWAGSANIQDGVTIDLSAWNQATVSSDGDTVYAGPGATWGDIYSKTDPLNLTVVGGRASQVGVAGLTLGGGLSYLAPRYGFVCDNVALFEVVLASGEITQAYPAVKDPLIPGMNEDLFQALKGGSNNFGIVTRIDYKTLSMGKMWGGQIVYNISQAPTALRAFADFTAATPYDEYATTIQSVAYVEGFGLVGVNDFEYTKEIANPPAFAGWDGIQPRLTSSLRIANLKDITDEQGSFSPDGMRQYYTTLTFKDDLGFLRYVVEIWKLTVTSRITNISGINYALTFQPLPPAITSKTAANGGDVLGLSKAKGPLVLAELSIMWKQSSDDEIITETAKGLISNIEKAARAKGLHDGFIYLNYAAPGQDPIKGYGADNVRNLRAVSEKYDPKGVFQKQVKGGFKLPA